LHEPGFFANLDATLKAGNTWSGVLKSKTRDGRLVQLETTIAPIRDERGEIVHHVAVKRDITERLERQQALNLTNKALKQARDAALTASRAKSEFLANMSHELRTPLNAILGYSEMLLEEHEGGDAQMLKDLNRIHTSGSHLLALINDVLDISKIEADKIELHYERIVVADLVETVRATLDPLAKKNENEIVIDIGDGIDAVTADRTRLRQILFNLLSNACKFTRHGRVGLAIEKFEHHGEPWVQIQVSDSGIGISESQQQRLFQPFVQADASTTREFGGTGLGLVICKRLCEIMGGDISMESEIDVGTTFTIRLPIDSRIGSKPIVVAPDGATYTILLIDDDPNIQDLFSRALTKRGFNVQVASNGTEGLIFAHQLQPDAIVLDVKLPGMSGWEVLSTLKLSADTKSIPVIMLTIMEQREVGQSLGAVDYLVKPIEPNQLTDALRRHIHQHSARVLVVEDDEPTRELICRTLENAGHATIEAENGQVALDKLDEANADVVVLDLMMPVMDGVTFLHHLRAHSRFSALPVLVATARMLSDTERQELETMVERVIEKNAFSRRELLDRIDHQVCRILERAAAGPKSAS
jgi:signal transduction histidine kinase/DNA-binding response OmpR family regulator